MGFPTARLVRLALPALSAVGAVALLYYLRRLQKGVRTPFLERKRKKVQILDVKNLTSDTKRFRLSLGDSNKVLGLPVGKHIVLYAPNPLSSRETGLWNGKEDPETSKAEIERKYTPVTGNESLGFVDLVVKVYSPGKTKMPDGKEIVWEDGGKLGLYLDRKKPGDYIEINGPMGVNEYLGCGAFKLPGRTVNVKRVAMLAGGTGLTPMLQVVTAALRDPTDRCRFSLLYANKTEDDILCRDMLDSVAAQSGGRFKIYYTLDFPPTGWKHKQGFITQEMIKECMPPPADDVLVLMCGPPPMVEFACKRNLEALGYAKERMASF
eukprot:TRINITY_DN60736_c0_g1_i1.p1 TRINITY_DN60736_c0_g1~~TRINITY_DN60736_c0_g1_i1.p1  ORF type:complete len:323 (+),score=59.37 TRINITY_DN60736_c0_g1_i1:115-1083(+)